MKAGRDSIRIYVQKIVSPELHVDVAAYKLSVGVHFVVARVVVSYVKFESHVGDMFWLDVDHDLRLDGGSLSVIFHSLPGLLLRLLSLLAVVPCVLIGLANGA